MSFPEGMIRAAPGARRLARDNNIDLKAVIGTGNSGYVKKADVQKAIDARTAVTEPPRKREEKEARRQERRERVPLGTTKLKLDYSHRIREGYVGRVVNNVGGRLEQAQMAGYEFISDELGKEGTGVGTPISQIVGTKEDGSPLEAFLMEIPREFYEEDQAKKQEQVDRVDEAIKTGNVAGTVGQDGRYVPEDSGRSRINVDRR